MIFNIASANPINAYVLICVDGSLCGDGVLLLQIGTTSSAQSQLLDVFDLTINQNLAEGNKRCNNYRKWVDTIIIIGPG